MLCLQVKTHSGGSREWRGVSSYQAEDDLHGGKTHTHGFDWNSIWSFYLFALPSGVDHRWERGEEHGPGWAIIIQDTSPKVTWLKLHWRKSPLAYEEVQTVWNYYRLDWISRIHSLLWPSSNEPLIAAEWRECCVPGTQSSHSSN